MKKQYWTVYYPHSRGELCTKHRTLKAAIASSRDCESIGGGKHKIFEVKEVSWRHKPK